MQGEFLLIVCKLKLQVQLYVHVSLYFYYCYCSIYLFYLCYGECCCFLCILFSCSHSVGLGGLHRCCSVTVSPPLGRGLPHCSTDPFSILFFTERKPRSSWCQPWFGAPLVRHASAGATTEGRRRTRLSTALPRHWSTVTARAGHPRRPPACHFDSGSLVVLHGMLGSSFFSTVQCALNWRDAM